jgi:chemotaxis protein MotB
LQKDTAAKDQALQAEKDTRQKTEQARADLDQKLKAAQDEGGQLKKQLDAAAAQGQTLAQVQKEKDALAGELDALKKKTAKDLETAKTQVSRASAGAAEDPELKDTASQFTPKLKGQGIQTKVDRRGLRIIIPSGLLFDENATILADRAAGVLTSVAGLLKQVPGRTVRVEGHTDNQAVQDLPFADNWGLGFARADRVREYLMKEGGVSGSRLEALSRAQFEPLASNDTAEGRKLNRRVEIVIVAK